MTDHPSSPRSCARSSTRAARSASQPARRPPDRRARRPAGRGGYRTLTIAADGAVRAAARGDRAQDQGAAPAAAAELVPRPRDEAAQALHDGRPARRDRRDIDELVRFAPELSRVAPRVALGIAPFVAKRNTPLDGAPFGRSTWSTRSSRGCAPRSGAASTCARPRRSGPGSSTCSRRAASPPAAPPRARRPRRRTLRRLEGRVRRRAGPRRTTFSPRRSRSLRSRPGRPWADPPPEPWRARAAPGRSSRRRPRSRCRSPGDRRGRSSS